MTDNDCTRRLSSLRTDVDRSLRSFVRRALSSARASAVQGSRERRPGASEGASAPPASEMPRAGLGSGLANVRLMGAMMLLDDERRARALAKEIKRLIMEDTRRGLSIGGQ